MQQDAANLFKYIEENRQRLQDYFPFILQHTSTLESTEAYVEERIKLAEKKEALTYFIIDTTANNIIGITFIKNFDWRIAKAELAYNIDKAYEGKGIITEALKHIINYCFTTLQLNKVYLRTAIDNTGSQKVALKNGFKLEGILSKEFKIFDGTLIDLHYYGLVKA